MAKENETCIYSSDYSQVRANLLCLTKSKYAKNNDCNAVYINKCTSSVHLLYERKMLSIGITSSG